MIAGVVIAVEESRRSSSEYCIIVDDTTALARILNPPSRPEVGDLIDLIGEYVSSSHDFVHIRGIRMTRLQDPNFEVLKTIELIRNDRIEHQVAQLKNDDQRLREYLQGMSLKDFEARIDGPTVSSEGTYYSILYSQMHL